MSWPLEITWLDWRPPHPPSASSDFQFRTAAIFQVACSGWGKEKLPATQRLCALILRRLLTISGYIGLVTTKCAAGLPPVFQQFLPRALFQPSSQGSSGQ